MYVFQISFFPKSDLPNSDIEEIGYHARLNADLAGRVDCNYNDVVAALSKMRVAIKDIIEFQSIHCAEEVPFARGIFPSSFFSLFLYFFSFFVS